MFNYTQEVVRRSRLIVPANSPKFLAKAYARNADAIVLDLEDSVPQAEKVATRQTIRASISLVGKGGGDVLVRVNHTAELLQGDVEAAIWPGVSGIVFPKVESAAEIQAIEKLIAELEQQRNIPAGTIKISVLIESGTGYLNMNEIAKASERIDSLTIGNEDFLSDLGIVANEHTYHALLVPRIQLVITARANQKIPMGLIGSLANYSDADAFAQSAVLAYQHGYLGASCINPRNVDTLNQCFSPSDAEIERAGRLIAAFDAALASGKGATTFEGKMIDYVHYEKAKKILTRQELINKFELKKQQAREAVTLPA
ncbi:MAG TPA: CoA ester lyase [Negativicutes bacterium]|nr:CoA ester lyase [Negativicutes bacterium]